MKDACIGIIIITGLSVSLVIICIVCFFSVCSYFGSIKAITSSPVEEMYHRQLVTTVDSILDSRYPCGITEDNSAYPSIDSLSTIAVPNNR